MGALCCFLLVFPFYLPSSSGGALSDALPGHDFQRLTRNLLYQTFPWAELVPPKEQIS